MVCVMLLSSVRIVHVVAVSYMTATECSSFLCLHCSDCDWFMPCCVAHESVFFESSPIRASSLYAIHIKLVDL